MSQLSSCRSCGAPVRWAISPSGKQMPFDAAPSERGNFVLRVATATERAEAVDLFTPKNEPRYLSHFATCPQAKGWRKK